MKQSRRDFLSAVIRLPANVPLLRWHAAQRLLFPDTRATGRFPKPEIIRYDSNCFTIHGSDTFIFSLEVPYPRIPRELWRDRLLKVRQAGFNTIDSYIFWNYHEKRPGQFDFSDLEEFFALAKESGLWVIARPGPYVDAEFERGGFPYWIIAKRFPVRSMHPESLKTSKYWYDHVLPVIRKNQVTEGGPVILMQIENELDFTTFTDTEQKEYIRFLARTAWDGGIEVPLITNQTQVVRDRNDRDMARIMDTCDFYPRWSFLIDRELQDLGPGATMEEKVAQSDRAVLASIRKIRKQQPDCLLGIAELGTGYYSKLGGKLSEDEEGVEPEQTNAFTKTLIEQGATYFNYYVGCGGTNFEWAAKGVTTSYDFAAPIREWGGLSEKYYVIRGIGAFLGLFGKLLTRSRALENDCHATNPDVSVSERVSGESAFVFLRGNTESEHHFKLSFRDPAGGSDFTVPMQGELKLGPHAMKILPIQVPVSGGRLIYSTAEISSHGSSGDRNFIVVYDSPGNLVEIALQAGQQPEIAGDVVYQTWDKERKAAILGMRVQSEASFILLNRRLEIVLVPRDIALRSSIEHLALNVFREASSDTVAVPLISDTYLLAGSGSDNNRTWAELDFRPGQHWLMAVLPSKPAGCHVSGVKQEIDYEEQWHRAKVAISTPPVPAKAIEIRELETCVERFDPTVGNWVTTPPRVLEEIGPIPYGYVKYRASIPFHNEPRVYLSAFTDDAKKVFVNGKFLPELSKAEKLTESETGAWFHGGENLLEISYELFGSTEFGTDVQMSELKGIASVQFSQDQDTSKGVEEWNIQLTPAAMRGREVDVNFAFGGWKPGAFAPAPRHQEFLPAFTWVRATFAVPKNAQGWSIPWRLVYEADRDTLIYMNGKFVGRFVTVGPQYEFYLPEPYLVRDGQANVLTLVLANTETAAVIRTLRVEPYADCCTHRTRVEFQW